MSGSKKRIIENGKSKLVPVGYVTNQRKAFEKERARTESERTKFYKSRTWQKCRYHQLLKEPLCERCLSDGVITQAVIVHHIIDTYTSIGWDKRMDPENLESICFSCHNKETFQKKDPPPN
ncbi:HNH endonuclease [Listeria monocytogenes]|nr:HNH endonuclease [Listeria monocytogenes]